MPEAFIAIFGDPLDLHVIEVEQRLAARGLPARLYPRHGPEPLLRTTARGLEAPEDTPRAVWAYRLPPPLIEAGPRFEKLGESTLAVTQVQLWAERGVRVVNPLEVGHGGQNKLLQLHRWAIAGVPVPDTFACLTAAHVIAAVAALGDAVVKPVTAGTHARRLRIGEPLGALPLPALVQRYVPGKDVRVYVVGAKVVSAALIEPASDVLDYRADPAYQRGELPYRDAELDDAERALLERAAQVLGLAFTGIDLRRGPGGPVLLEANPAPAFWDIEEKLGHPIAAAIAELLVG